MEAPLARLRRVEPVGAVHDDERQLDAEPLGHDLGVRAVDRDDAVRAVRPAPFGAGEEPARRTAHPGEVARLEVDVAGVVDDARLVPAPQVERDRDAHVGHAVVEVGRRARPTRARRTCERMVSGIAARRIAPAITRRGSEARRAGGGGVVAGAVGSSPSAPAGGVEVGDARGRRRGRLGRLAVGVGRVAGRPTAPRLHATTRRAARWRPGNGTPSAAVGATRRIR